MQKAIGQEKMNLTVPAYFLNHYALAEYRERITPTFFLPSKKPGEIQQFWWQ